jgi:hypothetical protein
MTSSEQRNLIELWLLAGEGTADEAQLAQLSAWLESDGDARVCVLDVARQQGWLAWNAGAMRLPAALAALADFDHQPKVLPTRTPSREAAAHSRSRWVWAALAASVLSFFAGQWFSAGPEAGDVAAERSPLARATMVSSTGCIWGPGSTNNLLSGGGLSGGDSLQLLEGIAEFHIGAAGSDVRLQMEGPASIVLTAHGAASFSYGKIVVKTGSLAGAAYGVETSFGRVLIEPHAEIGLVSFGSTAEVHSFRGAAAVESPWIVSDDASDVNEAVVEGEALHLRDVGDASLEAMRGPAQRGRFALQVPMSRDFLAVGPDYVQEITESKPVAYWRFEGPQAEVVPNEMGNRFHGRLKGQVRWIGPEGNRAIEFGVTPEPGSLIVAESWDEVLDGDFALEAWIKPSHYHLGSIMGFIGEFDWLDRRNKHGVLLEVNGTSQPSDIHQPQRIRFLHRATLGVQGGVSCYSDRSYQPRRWQHVAAVREASTLRLYLDGEMVQEGEDPASTPLGLQLVIGQLYTETVERFFIGHLDEVAIYDRALPESEVRRHYELLREKQDDGKDKAAAGEDADVAARADHV